MNTQKTKAMRISTPGAKKPVIGNYELKYKGELIEWVSSFSYLGVEITEKGHLQTHKATMFGKANRAQFKLMKLVRSLKFDLKLWLHRAMVDPILLHGAEVWVTQNRAKAIQQKGIYNTYADKGQKPLPGETIKRAFVRIQMGAPRFAPVLGIRGDSGEYPLYIEGLARAMKFRNKIELEDTAALQTHKELMECNQECWLLTIQQVEDKLTCLKAGRLTGDKAELVKLLRKDYEQNWRKELRDCNRNGRRNSRARWYWKLKRNMKREEYLNGPRSNIQVAIVRQARNLWTENVRDAS